MIKMFFLVISFCVALTGCIENDESTYITDDNGQQLTQNSMQIIERDLGHLYTALEQRDLAAGSAQARRLFS